MKRQKIIAKVPYPIQRGLFASWENEERIIECEIEEEFNNVVKVIFWPPHGSIIRRIILKEKILERL